MIRDVLVDNLSRLMWLIDEGNDLLDICILPLLYSLNSQGVKITIEKILENPTENDWKALLKLDEKLEDLQLQFLRKEFLTEVIPKNAFNTKESITLGLNAIYIFNKELSEIYLSKINICTEFFGEDSDLINLLGTCYKKLGNYENALEFYQKSMSIRLKILSDENLNIAKSYNNIGMIWSIIGNYDIASDYINKSLTILLKSLTIDHPLIADNYINFGLNLYRKGDFDKALEYFKKSLTIYKINFGGIHPRVALSYNNIGGVWESKGYFDEALKYYKMSLEIRLKTLGNEHTDVAKTYHNIGLIFMNNGQYDKALVYYKKSLKNLKKNLGRDHSLVAQSYNDIAHLWNKKGEYDKASDYYEKSLDIQLKIFGKDHTDVAKLYFDIGNMNININKFELAIIKFQKGFLIQKKSGFPFKIAECYEALNDNENALEFYIQSSEIRKDDPDFGIDHEATQEAIANANRVAKELGKEDELPEWMI